MNNSISLKITLYSLILSTISCGSFKSKIVQIENVLDQDRTLETVELSRKKIGIDNISNLGVKDLKTGELIVSQVIDLDKDGVDDILLFQTELKAGSTKKYKIIKTSNKEKVETLDYCYSRPVPEREDDYAWENNKVAFRVYGPKGQELVESNAGSGILSSGVDIWLKRVEYPIINKWYKKTIDRTGSYHQDTGEGLDNFSVGVSRGVGGTAVKNNNKYFFSKNYSNYKEITTGPIRTSFILEYDSWDADGQLITETKKVSLDYGSNLTRYKVTIKGVDEISAGVAIHSKNNKISFDEELGWLSNWEFHGDSTLGTGIVAAPNTFKNVDVQDSNINAELNNAYMGLKVNNTSTEYYAGFGWKKSKQFDNEQEWKNYLTKFSEQLKSPLKISIVN